MERNFRTLAPAPGSPAASGLFADTLIYGAGDVSSYVFTFPKGRVVNAIASPGFGACADDNGDVYFTTVRSIAEYQHGGTSPIATFPVEGSAYSCSVDPTTGNVAAVVFCIKRCGDEVVVLRPDGKRERYRATGVRSLLYCAYDGRGDLFVDGYNGTQFVLLELRKRAKTFASIAFKYNIPYAAQIQWDGKDLAIETREHPVIVRVAVTGSTARVVGRTHLLGVGYRATQSWIGDGKIAVPTGPGTKRAIEIMVWDYPNGGNPTKVLKGFIGSGHAMIDAVAFSVRPGSR